MFEQDYLDAFWSQVDINWDDPNACWPWTGNQTGGGYGRFDDRPAHVIAWEIANSMRMPEGFFGCHHCDNKGCANPWHVFAGTNGDNVRDRLRKLGLISRSRHTRIRKWNTDEKTQSRVRRAWSIQRKPSLSGKLRTGDRDETARLIQQIRLRCDEGEAYTAIAKEFGVSRSAIHQIHRRQTYAWVS